MASAARHAGRLESMLPILGWRRTYTRADLRVDIVAGVITALLLIPQGMAYAVLAGLPPHVGIYASIAAPLAYAVFGSSRTLAVGPVSVAAVMVADALADPSLSGPPVVSALILAFECGLILLVLAVLRMGAMVNFLSHPVLTGFMTGAAIVIVATQVPPLLGIASTQSTALVDVAGDLITRLSTFAPAAAVIGGASVVLLVLVGVPLQRFLAKVDDSGRLAVFGRVGPMAVVVLATLAVVVFDLDKTASVATVGAVPTGLPGVGLGFLVGSAWVQLLPSALLIALISYVESVSIAKLLANRRRQRIDPNQELTALGAANLAAALAGGMPVAGGFGRTMVNFGAGARTQVAGIVAALIVAIALVSFAPWFARVPKAVLAAVVIMAVVPLIDVREGRFLWRYQRSEAAVFALTLAGVLLAGIEAGLIVGVIMSLLAYLWRTSRPHIAVVGRIPGTEHFRNIERHVVQTWPRLAFIRVDESLTFANIGAVEDYIAAYVATHLHVEHVVLICSAVNHIDSSALEALERMRSSLQVAGVTIHLAEVKGPVMDAVERAGLPAQLSPGRIFFRVADAVEALAHPTNASAEAGAAAATDAARRA